MHHFTNVLNQTNNLTITDITIDIAINNLKIAITQYKRHKRHVRINHPDFDSFPCQYHLFKKKSRAECVIILLGYLNFFILAAKTFY